MENNGDYVIRDKRGSCSKRYSYVVTSSACPNQTLSTAKKALKCGASKKKAFFHSDDIKTCYIASCESEEFVFEYRKNRQHAITFIVIGSIMVCAWVYSMYQLCGSINAALCGKKKYETVNTTDTSHV